MSKICWGYRKGKLMESYTIGDKYVPYWCRNRIMQYKRLNGTTGYEFHGKGEALWLEKGDTLCRGHNKAVIMKKKG
jgi:hypothetical protein